ncbi:MAG: DUF547 domain-containing protein [Pseudomonadota bacterium]
MNELAQRMTRGGLGLVLLLSIVTSASANVSNAASMTVETAYETWGRVLDKHVDGDGRIGFKRLANDRADLNAFVAWVSAVSPTTNPNLFPDANAVLAYHINAYNAWSMHEILESDLPKTLGGLRKWYFFGVRGIVIGGEDTTLYTYENDVIRKMGDPRIHFALNCMSISCPRLPQVPFSPQSLDEELDRETRKFFAEARNVSVDHNEKRILLSEILDFFTEDFLATSDSLVTYVNQYITSPLPADYEVDFFDYDWGVNYQNP